ncbi:unnamed protein product [Rhizoctonia solani]|uniref:F-box domain-containing protein n=1 Tax=Rhizoctonia solani TaxID=456999 RepID=A0A8H3GRE8_9AGAM|nr:unnamed protein product [Rhizoctonia solani]
MNRQLESSSSRLAIALNRYLDASLAMGNSCTKQSPTDQTFRDPAILLNQLPRATLFEQKIQRAKTAIGFARNRSPAIVPIHRLPPELLSHIFGYIVVYNTCVPNFFGTCQLQKRLISLTHVCAHWRKIAISSPSLWSHIDISLPLTEKSRSCMNTFLSRAGKVPLDLSVSHNPSGSHIFEPEDQINIDLKEIVSPLIHRVRGLKCNAQPSWLRRSETEFCLSTLSSFLNKDAAPGRLTMLDACINSGFRVFHLQTIEDPQNEDVLSLDIPAFQLEELLLPVTVLRLHNIFPHWGSKAFHGLVDLRLCAVNGLISIHELQLATILRQSPLLRVLEIGIGIDFVGAPVVPVALYHLEALITRIPSYSQLGRVLRLIDTGSGPLFMTIMDSCMDDELNDNVKQFFTHSNVTILCAIECNGFRRPLELANLIPTIKKVAMTPQPIDPRDFYNQPGSPIRVRLDMLYLLGRFEFEVNRLRDAVDWSGVERLTIWGHGHEITRNERPIVNNQVLQNELSKFGVAVEMISADLPSPIEYFFL